MTTHLDRLQGWVAEQSVSGGDARFVLLVGLYVIVFFAVCALLAFGLDLLVSFGVSGAGE